ncbi:hypothetical protein ANO14919_062940 [Xylariales sp. No.14919]|nr:hypothetical protein ANO14919_062940 [Xylariales sp. No.14919]
MMPQVEFSGSKRPRVRSEKGREGQMTSDISVFYGMA